MAWPGAVVAMSATVTDLFCGAGGSSLGARHAGLELVMATVGTGHPIPEDPGEYLGTVQDVLGLVWHYFIGPPS